MEDFYLWADCMARLSNSEMLPIMTYYGEYVKSMEEDVDFREHILGFINFCRNRNKDRKDSGARGMDSLVKEISIKKMEGAVVGSISIADIKLRMKAKNIKFITFESSEYPSILRQIYDPPHILYYRGDVSILNEKFILAVVGSRDATEYGKSATKKLLEDIARDDIAIVSGLARGVDSYAHIFCIENDMKTIAVLGSAIDNIYPKMNYNMAEEIIRKGGLIISEHNIGEVTRPFHFAMRNRIISGISHGVIVTEAKRKSGALVTCESALSQNRNVYAVPGSVFSQFSHGTNEIIQKGAKLVQSGSDIMEDFEHIFGTKKAEKLDRKNEKEINYFNKFNKKTRKSTSTCDNISLGNSNDIILSNEEEKVLDLLLNNGELNIDQLVVMSGMDIGKVLVSLNKLLFSNIITEVDSNTYAKK